MQKNSKQKQEPTPNRHPHPHPHPHPHEHAHTPALAHTHVHTPTHNAPHTHTPHTTHPHTAHHKHTAHRTPHNTPTSTLFSFGVFFFFVYYSFVFKFLIVCVFFLHLWTFFGGGEIFWFFVGRPFGPHLFWVWRCCGYGCCGCCWFGLPWTTLRRTPLHQTPLHRTAQNFALFFPLPPPTSLFFSLTVCFLVEFWWFLWRPGPSNVHVWALELSCPRTTRAHLRSRRFKHHQNSTRRQPERDKKRKKNAKFWAPHPEGTDFGQSRFGHPDLTNPILANPTSFLDLVCIMAQRVGPKKRKNRAPKGGAPKWSPFGAPPFVAPGFGTPLFLGLGPFVVQKFNIQKLAEVEIDRSRKWPKSKLAEVKLAELEKKKLAEVEIGRSRPRSAQIGQTTNH